MQATSQSNQSGQPNEQGQQQTDKSNNFQSWWEEMGSKLSGLPEQPAGWIKWLSSPLLTVIGMAVLGYYLYRTRKELIEILSQQKNTTTEELALLRKQVKKLKKQVRQSSGSAAKSAKPIMD